MIIRDIIKSDEYILSEVDDRQEFQRLTTDIGDTTDKDVLIIPNSAKVPKNITDHTVPREIFLGRISKSKHR